MTKIVYERLKVDEKKQIKAGIGQLPISETGCSSNVAPPSKSPITIENRCLGIDTAG